MKNIYIKNKGISKTFIQSNDNNSKYNSINWDLDYDGKKAYIDIDIDNNGNNKQYNFQLNNNDLAEILNLPIIETPIEKRLITDYPIFQEKKQPKIKKILHLHKDINIEPFFHKNNIKEIYYPNELQNNNNDYHISNHNETPSLIFKKYPKTYKNKKKYKPKNKKTIKAKTIQMPKTLRIHLDNK